MALNPKWIDQIFARLTVRYGSAFLNRWTSAGVDLELVKADWAEELSGFEHWPEAIKHALDTLPADKPAPTVTDFKAACYRAPKPDRQALPEPAADPARVKSEMAKLEQRKPAGVNVYTDWIRRGLADLEAGVKKSPTVERMVREAAAAKGIA